MITAGTIDEKVEMALQKRREIVEAILSQMAGEQDEADLVADAVGDAVKAFLA